MDLSPLLSAVAAAPSLRRLTEEIAQRRHLAISVLEAAKGAAIAALFVLLGRPMLVVVPKPQQAEELTDQLKAWLGDDGRTCPFPPREAVPYDRTPPDPQLVAARLLAIQRLQRGEKVLVVASALALAQTTISPPELKANTVVVRVGGELEPQGFLSQLLKWGYSLVPMVERPGEVARRGGIIDIFPPTSPWPVRLELWGRKVEEMRHFQPETQRSLRPVDEVEIGPAKEALFHTPPAWLDCLDTSHLSFEAQRRLARELEGLRCGGGFQGDHFYVPFLAQATLLDHLPPDALVVVSEWQEVATALTDAQERAREAARELASELPRGLPPPIAEPSHILKSLEACHHLITLHRWQMEGMHNLPFSPLPHYGGQLRRLTADLHEWRGRGQKTVIVSQQAPRLAELLAQEGMETSSSAMAEGPLVLVHGSLPGGWRLEETSLTLVTDHEIFGFTKERRALPRRYFTLEATLAELRPGDYVVHMDHGIARFAGVVRSRTNGTEREYLELQYAEGQRLLVPVEQVDRISRYIGPSGFEPPLTRLGSGEWQRTKQRVRRAVTDLARELLMLYADREVLPGHAFSPDTPWQLELEASFPYLETPDQLAAIAEVKRDMESPRPMDRLVCGDVGYGKTEIALRAAFKAVMDGKQVAVLVPTTVLAQQHWETFRRRLAPFPVRVAMLSRLISEREQREVIEALARGDVDIVIGTHRLLQPDVHFKDLGLVIIDEEQRFGVGHKEHLKMLRRQVDVLTLSATPIPRTLYMALGGVRDMSLLETPPESRLPIRTYVGPYDPRLVKEAIRRELGRGGQVYYVHNRVQTIAHALRRVQELVPEARLALAHGQMDEEELALVMDAFRAQEVDVLVCTTIIEAGLDIPNVNTIIVEDAHRLGLAQLYQLRGRVGRSDRLAYAYLLYDRQERLTEAAQRRLQAIFEAHELGAGFQVALRDLEIRGAGNLLGPEQSGHMAAVGLELYTKLLAEATRRLQAARQGQPPPPEPQEVLVDLPIAAYLPEDYVPQMGQRLYLYQRLATAPHVEAVMALKEEMEDRFGPLPPPAQGLIFLSRLRALARQAGIRSLALEGGKIVARMADQRPLPPIPPALRRWLEVGPTTFRLDPVRLGEDWPHLLHQVLEALAEVDRSGVDK
ncbi:MAG: transcription-repair coupling factor [Dehalococcoidia bacterium]|nr:transcription-repair coupling factor [Dehalococcoidia bacterium]